MPFVLNFFTLASCDVVVPVKDFKSTSQKMASVKLAPSRFAPVITAAVKSTPERFAPTKLTLVKSARINNDLARFAPAKLAPVKVATLKF